MLTRLEERELADLRREEETITAKAKAESRDLSESEAKHAHRLLDRIEQLYSWATDTNRPGEISSALPRLTAGAGDLPSEGARLMELANPGAVEMASGGPAKDKHFRSMFGLKERNLDTGGFTSLDEFLRAVHAGRADRRLDALQQRAMSEGVGAEGGFSVPELWSGQWLDTFLESEIVRPRAEVWPMKSDKLVIPGFDDKAHTSNLFGGLKAYWVQENSSITESAPTLRKLTLNAKKLAIFAVSSNELTADGVNFQAQLEGGIVAGGSWYLDDAFLTGSGAGEPLGALNSNCLVQVELEGAQAGMTIVYENLTKMLARLHPACYANAQWVANPTTIPQLAQLTVDVGTGGAYIPVMKESNGQFSILTLPVRFTEKAPALGEANCISLCDFTQYAIGLRKELTLDRSGHIYFDKDQTAYRLIIRADGQPKWASAIVPKNGDSLSPFIGLEANPE